MAIRRGDALVGAPTVVDASARDACAEDLLVQDRQVIRIDEAVVRDLPVRAGHGVATHEVRLGEPVIVPRHFASRYPYSNVSADQTALADMPFYDPYAALSYLAARTTTLLLGLSVAIVPLHDPYHLARSVATVDLLSGGRLLWGVGTGRPPTSLRRLLGRPIRHRRRSRRQRRRLDEPDRRDPPGVAAAAVTGPLTGAAPGPGRSVHGSGSMAVASGKHSEVMMDARGEPVAGLHGADREEATRRRQVIAGRHLRPAGDRPTSAARGVHHVALLSSDVERTVGFYQDLLEFPLTDMFENRDYGGSTHFFFDVGNGNALAFFDLPGLDLGPYAEVLGGLHHLAISVEPERWERLKAKLDAAGISYAHIGGSSLYFNDPDGARLELIRDPLGEMYGQQVV